MLNIFVPTAQGLHQGPCRLGVTTGRRFPTAAVWLDLLEPTVEEEKLVEAIARASKCRRARK